MKAILEVVKFSVADVITTSDGGYDPDNCVELDLPEV